MLNIRPLLESSLSNIVRNGMRSILTALGIIIGVSAVIIMVAIGRGSEKKIQDGINALGTNLIIVFPGTANTSGISRGGGSFSHFTFDDVDKLKKESTFLSGVSPIVRASGQVIGNGNNWSTSVYGISEDYYKIRNWQIAQGEFFDDDDVKANKKVVLLGKTVADNLYPNEDPTGKQIRIRNTPFTVVGVLKAKGQSGMGNDQDDVILAPATTVFYRLKGGQFIDMINASASATERMQEAQNEIEAILRDAHRIQDGAESDFTVRDQADITETASATAQVMTLLLASIAGVSLFVGGIGIMNIMLVTVTERTREIGILRAVGATASDVLAQFLTEAAVLSLIGGITGILVAVAASYLVERFSGLTTSLSMDIIVAAVLFSGVVGVFFGYYPARKAASMNPIDALRYE